MNISKALKVKNRLVGELAKLQEVFKRENSRRNDNPSEVDPKKVFGDITNTFNRLVELKGAINEASAPISKKLAELAELKQFINFYLSVPTKEGEELTLIGSNREKLSYMWTAYMNREEVDTQVSIVQKRINTLQDEIDDFNASTSVKYTE